MQWHVFDCVLWPLLTCLSLLLMCGDVHLVSLSASWRFCPVGLMFICEVVQLFCVCTVSFVICVICVFGMLYAVLGVGRNACGPCSCIVFRPYFNFICLICIELAL